MTRKKFVKQLMALGIHRNAANYLARNREPEAARMMGRAVPLVQITNCTAMPDGVIFKVKQRGVGGGHE